MSEFEVGDYARRKTDDPDGLLKIGQDYEVVRIEKLGKKQALFVVTPHGDEGLYWAWGFKKV